MTKIEQIIKERENGKFVFKPDREFYDTIKIGQKRWGQLLRGETDPTLPEMLAIAKFFNVEPTTLI